MKEFFKTNYLLFIKIILTIYTLYSLKYLFKLKHIESEFYVNITFLFVIAAVYLLIDYTLNLLKSGINRRLIITSAILGLFLTFTIILSYYYEGNAIGKDLWGSASGKYPDFSLQAFIQSLSHIPSLWFICFGFVLFIYDRVPYYFNNIFSYKVIIPKKYNSLYIVWLFILICWLPYFILLYPGYIVHDVSNQILQVFVGQFSSHHPVLSTLTHYFTMFIFKLTNNGILSLALYVLLMQMIPLSFAFAYMLYKIYNLFKINDIIYILLILYCALFPIHPLWSIVITKDILFFIMLIIFLTETLILIYTPDLFKNKRFIIKYLLITITVCLLRHNMIYALFMILPVFLLVVKNYRKQIFFIFTIIFILYISFNEILVFVTHASEGNKRASLSLPAQQLARVYKYQYDTLSDENKEYIESVINSKNLTKYESHLSDPIINGFQTDVFLNKDSIIQYFKIGITYPNTYLNSVLLMSAPLWNLFSNITWNGYPSLWIVNVGSLNLKVDDIIDTKNKQFYKDVGNVLNDRYFSFFIFYFYNQSFYFYIFLFTFIYFIYKKEYRNVLLLLILLGYTITVLLGPIVYSRYTYYLIIIFPMLIMMLTNRNNSEIISNNSEK